MIEVHMIRWLLFAAVILAAVYAGHIYLAAIDNGCEVHRLKVTC